MTSYIERIRGPVAESVVPINGTRRPAIDGIHPYALAIRRAWLERLDDLAGKPWVKGDAWDTNCFVTARKLVELANSPWAGYQITDARDDYFSHAPRDHAWDEREKCWDQGEKAATGVALSEPAEGQTLPDVTVLPEGHAGELEVDPLLRFNLIDWHGLKRTEDIGEDWLIEPLVAAGRMTALYSAPKAGKSLLVLELVAALALGQPLLDLPPRSPVSVLYIDFENDPRGDIKPRLEDMGHDLDDLEGKLHVASFPSVARFDTAQGGQDLLWVAQQVGARLVVIDTVSRTVGGEENDNNTWLNFYRNTGVPLKRDGIACLRLDHSGKDKERGMRGGSAKYGDVDAVWKLEMINEATVILECTANRMQIPVGTVTLVRESFPLAHKIASGDALKAALDAKATRVDHLLDALQVPSTASFREAGKALRTAGEKVENVPLAAAVRARKMRLDTPLPGVPGTPAEHPGTPGGSVPGTPPPLGGVRNISSGAPGTPSETDDELVSCKTCFKPTTAPIAEANDGLCATCFKATGQETR